MKPASDKHYCFQWCERMRWVCVRNTTGRYFKWVLAHRLGRVVPGRVESWGVSRRYVERMSNRSINTRMPVLLPIHRKRSMYLTCLHPPRGSFRMCIVSFIMLSYHRFSEASSERPTASANFGLARSIYLCQSALSVRRRACKAKRKCPPTVFLSSRELRIWNHFKKCSVVPPLHIG
jgi:hypothetical protein